MKKKCLSMVLVLLAVVASTGYGGPKVYDKSVPAEQCGTLIVPMTGGGSVKVTEFNGKKVSWEKGAKILIPAGTHSLQLFSKTTRNVMLTNMNISDSTDLTHTFLAGHTYWAIAELSGGDTLVDQVLVKIQVQILDVTGVCLDFIQRG